MQAVLRWTTTDLKTLPDNGNRYEIIDGELYVSTAPRHEHQNACGGAFRLLDEWSRQTKLGKAILNPGVIFADDNDVIPDVVWISRERYHQILRADGHFHGAPELVVEVLSFTGSNEKRDREAKLNLYSRRDVKEYWIVNWLMRQVEIYRRKGRGLKLAVTLNATDSLTSPLLPGFSHQVREIFDDYLADDQHAGKNGSRNGKSRKKIN
jgi:Uma2 family endonuclease